MLFIFSDQFSDLLVFSYDVAVILSLVRNDTILTILIPLLCYTKISTALLAQRIEGAITK